MGTGGSAYGAGPTAAPAAFFEKDFSNQINFGLTNNTTLKQVALGLNGTIPGSSWSWDAHGRYGQTSNLQSGQQFSVLSSSMALDAVAGPGGAPHAAWALAGLPARAASAAMPTRGGGLQRTRVAHVSAGVQCHQCRRRVNPTSPVSGLSELQTLQLFSLGCQPLNPFGNQPLSASSANYAINPLALQLEQTMSSFNVNATGEFWKGFGAGAFSAAARL